MSDKKFLTVMAVFDDQTQEILSRIQSKIIENVGMGTQTMGIPFHLTLGSYPTESEAEVVAQIEKVASVKRTFEVSLLKYNTFSNRVLFLEPTKPQELIELRKRFESDFANGFEWVPHATIFCGDSAEVDKAKSFLPQMREPIQTKIVGIELGEFFPPRKIIRINFE